jgi:hypothetical protein
MKLSQIRRRIELELCMRERSEDQIEAGRAPCEDTFAE